MRKIVLNERNLKDDEIEIKRYNASALIIDDNNVVTLCNYDDVYMLPGGRIGNDESTKAGLLRALSEEVGLEFENKDLEELVSVVTIAGNYPACDGGNLSNKAYYTDYYIIRTNRKIDKNKIKLTDREKKHKFRIEYIPMDRIIEVIENNEHYCFRNKYFVKELFSVLSVYLKKECKYSDNGLIDLHIHTTASDGELSSNKIIEEAIRLGAQAISITDHDTIMGYRDLEYDKNKIKVISGIELSAFSEVGRMHILGYGFDLENKGLNDWLAVRQQNSINNILKLIDILKKNYGINFNPSDIEELIKLERNIGRPDLAKLMLREGMVNSVNEAFDRYLTEAYECVRFISNKPTYKECFSLIKEAGGIPVLAHPHTLLLDNDSLYNKIIEMKNNGLEGIEAYHSNNPKYLTSYLIEIALNEGLYLTGGSDYHGIISKPNIKLFSGKNNIKVKRLNLVRDIKCL